MKISVIIPAYQAEKTLRQCLSSILNQTYQEYEIIVVNDGSTDQTKEILDEISKKIPTLNVIHQENMGAMDARINGIEIATGDYVLFLDSDDWLVGNALELLHQVANESHSDVILYHAYMVVGQTAYLSPMYTASLEKIQMDPLQAFFDREIGGFICGKMVKLSFLKGKAIRFPKGTSYGEDVAMFYSLFMHHPSISCCHEHLYFYVKIEKPIPDYCVDIIKSIDFVGEQLKEQGIYEEYESDYQLMGTRYTIEIYNTIQHNPKLRQKLWENYRTWNLKYFNQ